MSKKLKKWMSDEMRADLGGATACVVLGYKTLDGGTSAALRDHLRQARVGLTVLRNRVAAHALAGTGLQEVIPLIKGPTAVATGGEDAAALAKAVVDGVRGRAGFECRGGFLDGRTMSGEEVRFLAALPGRPELLSMIASVVSQPVTNIAFGIDAILTGMARAVGALQEKRAQEGAAPEAAS